MNNQSNKIKYPTVDFERLNYAAIERQITRFIREKTGDKPVLIGLSGGIDSTLTCELAIRAKGAENVKVLIVKNIRYPKADLEISRRYAKQHGLEVIEVESDISRGDLIKQTSVNPQNTVRMSSLDARLTDVLLRTYAEITGSIYLGTINGTERLTGWYPKGALFGDFCPIGGLLKGQIKGLAKYLELPDRLVNTVAQDASRICSGCGELPEFVGIPYEVMDKILYLYETSTAFDTWSATYQLDLPVNVYLRIMKRIRQVRHKQDIFPSFPLINAKNDNYLAHTYAFAAPGYQYAG